MADSKQTSCLGRSLGCFAFLVLAFFALVFLASIGSRFTPDDRPSAPAPESTSAPMPMPELEPGIEAIINLEGGKGTWLAVDDASYDAMLDAENAQDLEELGILMARGKVFREENGTRIKVLKVGFLSAFVRVRDGTNPGAEGWVQKESVSPMKNPRP